MAILLSFKSTFVTIGLFSFVVNILLLVSAIYMLQIYDRVITSRNQDTLLMLTVILVVAYLIVGFLEWIRSQLQMEFDDSATRVFSPVCLCRSS